ncbi:MAG: SPOR domain-containing protein [Alphaproteobacteria bacterium]|nr:SPOR domain-containing protein [Alphaproteobacteria bacterium]
MSQRNNPYSTYNFANYDQDTYVRQSQGPGAPPRRPSSQSTPSLKDRIRERIGNPAVATGALLVASAAFAGIIIASYPSSNSSAPPQPVPIIRADSNPFKSAPENAGGMQLPNQGSTVFGDGKLAEKEPVENLFDKEEPMDKLEAFAKEAEATYDKKEAAPAAPSKTIEISEVEETEASPPSEITESVSNEAEGLETKIIEQKVEKIPPRGIETAAKTESAPSVPAAPAIAHPAGSSPDTLAFVKSVLDKKDDKVEVGSAPQPETLSRTPVQESVNTKAPEAPVEITSADELIQKIEPASGASTANTAAKAITPGTYYVQVGSVMEQSKADGEWKRIAKGYGSLLSSVEYRVQRAEISPGSIRYRLQAGPMSKESAASLCDSIKAQKPGGCLVVR